MGIGNTSQDARRGNQKNEERLDGHDGRGRGTAEYRQAEQAVRFQAHLLDAVEQAVIAIDLEGHIIYWNRFAETLYGWKAEEVIGRRISTVIRPEMSPDARADAIKGVNEEGRYETETIHHHRDGTPIYVHAFTIVLRDETGLTAGYVSGHRDVTERKRAEEALRQSEQRFRRYFELDLIGMAVTSPAKRFIEVNDYLCDLLGYNREELLRMTWVEITHPDDRDADIAQFERLLAGEIDGYSMDKRFIRKDGQVVDSIISGKCIRRPDGALDYCVVLLQDITERKRMEESLRQSKSLLAEAQHVARIGSWNLDVPTMTLTWSDELFRLYGFEPQAIEPSLDLLMPRVHPDDRESARRQIDEALDNPAPHSLSYRIVRPDGEVRHFQAHANFVTDQQGRAARAFGTAQDVTERVQAEERLRISNEKLRALAARMQAVREEESLRIAREIHDDLGGALSALKIDLAWIDKRLARSRNPALRLKLNGMAELIDDTAKKVRSISTELRPSVLDHLGLAAAIEWQAKEFERRTEIECRIVALVEEVTLSAEKATAVFRIFQEILTNIARHAGAKLVEISLEEHDDLVLKVSDNGVGINTAELAASASLGLLGMRERALVFGGRVDIQGAQGQGTTVSVSIPRG
jgi:PAS domain S-box-containing protein